MTETTLLAGAVPRIQFNGSDARDDWYSELLELRVDLQLRLPGRATMRFNDAGYALANDASTKLGTAVTIGAQRSDDNSGFDTLLKGEITGIAVEQSDRGDPVLVLVAHDKGHRLTRGTTIGTFLQASVSDLVGTIAGNHGLSPVTTAPSLIFDYFMQADSDFALLDQIAARTGCEWWVDDAELHFGPAANNPRKSTVIPLTLGANLSSFSVRASGVHRPDSVKVQGWDLDKTQLISATSQASSGTVKPDTDMFADYFSPGSKLGGSKQLWTTGVAVSSTEEATKLADAMRDQAVSSAVNAMGTAYEGTKILPGVAIKVDDAGPTSGTYYVSKVEHVYRHTFESRFVAGDRAPNSIVDVVAPAATSGNSLRQDGLMVGIVTNTKDPESLGRVKVKLPAMDPAPETSWARVVTVGGGASRGYFAVPEVNDEVLVGFEGGDPRRPVVLGGLFNSKSKPHKYDVDEGSGDVLSRRISSRLGHYVELKDGTSPAEQYVMVALAGEEHKIRLGKDKADIEVPDNVPFTIKVGSNASIAIDAAGNLTIKAVNIKMESQANTEIKAGAVAKLDGEAQVEIHSAALTAIKADGTISVQSSGPAAVKGNPVAIN